jgi:putative ABC transport system substrate-binding protein
MDRRVFVGCIAGGLLASHFARAQQPDRARRIGLLLPYVESDSQAQARVTAFLTALQERGWVNGRNTGFEFRYSEGQPERLPLSLPTLFRRTWMSF